MIGALERGHQDPSASAQFLELEQGLAAGGELTDPESSLRGAGREVDLLVGSGGVLRNGPPGTAARVLAGVTGDRSTGGWQLPRGPRIVVDHDYVLAAAGLLAARHPRAAHALLGRLR